MTERVGFIGLGTMGAPMAWNVSRAGYDLRVYNRTAARTEPFAADGVPVAETPRALAADSDIIVVMVTGPEALETVIVGDDGVAAGLQTGALVINMSTVSREATLAAADAVSGAGGRFVDAPVSGTRKPAEDGTLTVLAGGDTAGVDAAEPVLNAMAKAVVRCGDVGQGTDTKHAINLLLGGMMQSFCEALVFGRKRGLDPAMLLEAIGTGATNAPLYQLKGKVIGERNFTKSFPVDLLLKDLDLVLAAGRESGIYLPQTATNREAVNAASARGYGDEDMAAVIKVLEEIARLEG
jgi:3-hydroxyisobutyrate dehydrogenase-like beta-hydroxyacid dehydrogenase